jgi:hypothetical protein
VKEELTESRVGTADHTLGSTPEKSVMDNEEVRPGLGGHLNGPLRNVNRSRDPAHRALMIDLESIQRGRVLGMPFDAEQSIEFLGEFDSADTHGGED